MTRLIVLVVLASIVATASTTAGQGSRQATPAAETDSRSRLIVTVQELIQRDHRLTVTAGTEVFWSDPHFERVWFPSGDPAPRVERSGQGFRAVFSTPGTYRGAFTIVGGHRSNDVYPLIVTVTER
jgi:type II secretory pathway pseudopilin PulG